MVLNEFMGNQVLMNAKLQHHGMRQDHVLIVVTWDLQPSSVSLNLYDVTLFDSLGF